MNNTIQFKYERKQATNYKSSEQTQIRNVDVASQDDCYRISIYISVMYTLIWNIIEAQTHFGWILKFNYLQNGSNRSYWLLHSKIKLSLAGLSIFISMDYRDHHRRAEDRMML